MPDTLLTLTAIAILEYNCTLSMGFMDDMRTKVIERKLFLLFYLLTLTYLDDMTTKEVEDLISDEGIRHAKGIGYFIYELPDLESIQPRINRMIV